MNDEMLRAQNLQVTKALLDDQAGSSFVDQQPIPWDLLDDYQVSMLSADSTFFNQHNPMEFSADWPLEAGLAGSEFTIAFNT
jgi:hypothetical protein